MSKLKGISYWVVPLILFCIVLLVAYVLFMSAYDAVRADTNDMFYMVLRPNKLGYDFECLDHRPYLDERQMAWSGETGFSELTERPLLIAQVIEVAYCHVDNIYLDKPSGEYFRWGFSERVTDEHPNHRHVTRGAYWVDERS